jgi:hypothetical protein
MNVATNKWIQMTVKCRTGNVVEGDCNRQGRSISLSEDLTNKDTWIFERMSFADKGNSKCWGENVVDEFKEEKGGLCGWNVLEGRAVGDEVSVMRGNHIAVWSTKPRKLGKNLNFGWVGWLKPIILLLGWQRSKGWQFKPSPDKKITRPHLSQWLGTLAHACHLRYLGNYK